MAPQKAFWYLRNWQVWLVLGMSVITALVIGLPWIVIFGILGLVLISLFEVGLDPSLGAPCGLRLPQPAKTS